MLSISFIISSLIVILLPGTGFIYTISIGITKGKRSAIYAATGCTAAIIPHMAVGILAMVFFHEVNAAVFNIVKLIGTGYLLFMGISMMKSGQSIQLEESDTSVSDRMIGVKGLLINLLNPKLSAFFLAFLPQYVNRQNGAIVFQGIILANVFLIISLAIFIIYALLAGMLHHFMITSNKKILWMQRISGMIFIAFALQLMLSRL